MTENPTQRLSDSPEYRFTAGLLRGLRGDLIDGAFAYRPLPPLAPDSPVVRRLPARWSHRTVWLPHALVGGMALLVLFAGATRSGIGGNIFETGAHLFASLLPTAAVLLTLVRPLGAFWLSLAITPFLSQLAGDWDMWPWTLAGFLAHLTVLTVVTARTRPRTGGWMWLLTALFAAVITALWEPFSGSNAFGLLFLSALVLLCVTVVQTRRQARQDVTAQQQVTAVERGRRTLLEERTTIARELHDVVAHHMSVVAIQAEAAPYRVENTPPELAQAFVTIRENAVAALAELRRVLGVVRAEDQEAPDAPQPTLADLDALLANVRQAGLDAELVVTGAARGLPQGVELSAYRIVQEALSNVLRHAPGAAAKVEIGHVLGGLGLRIVNGPPTGPVPPSPGAGHGVTGMRERVSMLDGEMTAGPAEDGGYEVAVFLPVPPAPTTEEPGKEAV
ncbi:sensor histidine kinase [Streptomyces sp. NPDC058045]|uniref:sensor histidine kinase n=1 Tax=Streptomyces sp. NPDC058045 TaxID=3346311 RepID=UPI0036E676E1